MRIKVPENIIKAFLESNFGRIKETSTGEWRINSPFEVDKKMHLYIHPKKALVMDFKSGYKGTFTDFVATFLSIPKNQVLPLLLKEYSNRTDLENFKIEEYIDKSPELVLPEGLHFFVDEPTGPIRDQAYNYLVGRHIPEENIQDLGYVYAPGTEFDRTIFIPFYECGSLVYFTTRDFTGTNRLRYSNPHGINSKRYIYNYDRLQQDCIFVFEGVFDAISLRPPQNGTAILSADLNRDQAIRILEKAPYKVVFVPDNDETGKKTLEKNIRLLLRYKPPSISPEVLVYEIKDAKDFNETLRCEIRVEECKKFSFNNIYNKITYTKRNKDL
jgi:hypothetical protein